MDMNTMDFYVEHTDPDGFVWIVRFAANDYPWVRRIPSAVSPEELCSVSPAELCFLIEKHGIRIGDVTCMYLWDGFNRYSLPE